MRKHAAKNRIITQPPLRPKVEQKHTSYYLSFIPYNDRDQPGVMNIIKLSRNISSNNSLIQTNEGQVFVKWTRPYLSREKRPKNQPLLQEIIATFLKLVFHYNLRNFIYSPVTTTALKVMTSAHLKL